MPFPMKIQPIDSNTPDGSFRNDPVKPVVKSRFKRLFERQFQSVMRISSSEKPGVVDQHLNNKDDLEPSSVCLAKMVQNFIEERDEKQTKCGRNRCNCFHGNCNDSSDDELDFFGGVFCCDSVGPPPSGDACEILKNLVSCVNITERNLLADTSKIVETNKICKSKDDCRKIVTEALINLGYDASICKSHWGKSPSYPAGEYEYIDVMVEGGDRLIIDTDFRSEFEIARSTKKYRAVLQSLPLIFVGKPDRLQQVISIVSEGAKQSLKKKGMHLPPWRKAEYMRAKWLSSFTRAPAPSSSTPPPPPPPTPSPLPLPIDTLKSSLGSIKTNNFSGEFELIFGDEKSPSLNSPVIVPESGESVPNSGEEEKIKVIIVSPWQPPAIKPKSLQRGTKIVTGLTSILKEEKP